jgi:NAD(P)-dependent dehydrogenase (short-subunit alcohol dehydrogenase family)
MPTALVTGASRGIGLELCRQLRDRGYDVIGTCREPSPELSALGGVRVVSGIDVAADGAPAALAREVGSETLHLVIQNAGMLQRNTLDDFDAGSIRRQLEVNAVGPLRLTHALLPNLRAGSKVAFMTSLMGSIGDNGTGGSYGYRMSKAALNAAAVSLARDLRPRGIAVVILHPGMVRTDMTHGHGNWDAPEAVAGLLARVDETTIENSGRFVHANGKQLPW